MSSDGVKIIEKSIFDLTTDEAQIIAFPVSVKAECEKRNKLAKKFSYCDFTNIKESGKNKLFGSSKKSQRYVLAMYAKPRNSKCTEFTWFSGLGVGKEDKWWFDSCLKGILNIKGTKSIAFPYDEKCSKWEIFYERIIKFAKKSDIQVILAKPIKNLNTHNLQKMWSELEQCTFLNSDHIIQEYNETVESGGTPNDKNKKFLKYVYDYMQSTKLLLAHKLVDTNIPKPQNPSKEFLLHVWNIITTEPIFDWKYFVESYQGNIEDDDEVQEVSENEELEVDDDEIEDNEGEEEINDNEIEETKDNEEADNEGEDLAMSQVYSYRESNIDESYLPFFNQPNIRNILKVIFNKINSEEKPVNPKPEHVFRVFEMPLKEIKVLFFGQDPYPNSTAIGYAFAHPVPKAGEKINGSLRNMITCIRADQKLGVTIPNSYDTTLLNWRKQGVFLINAALTTTNTPEVHSDLWAEFTEKLCKWLREYLGKCVLVYLGVKAKKFEVYFSGTDKFEHVYEVHPSPMNGNKFVGCCLFSRINEKLKSLELEPIDWSLDNTDGIDKID